MKELNDIQDDITKRIYDQFNKNVERWINDTIKDYFGLKEDLTVIKLLELKDMYDIIIVRENDEQDFMSGKFIQHIEVDGNKIGKAFKFKVNINFE